MLLACVRHAPSGVQASHAHAAVVSHTARLRSVETHTQHTGKPLVLFFYPKAATPGCTKEVG